MTQRCDLGQFWYVQVAHDHFFDKSSIMQDEDDVVVEVEVEEEEFV